MNDDFSIEILRGDNEIHRFMQWRKGDGNLETICEIKETLGGVQAGTVWVYIAKIGENWVGHIKLQRFHEDDEMADGAQRAYLGALEVEPEWRRRGIGRALMLRALQAAKKRGFTEITLNVEPLNRAARALYLELGFKKFRDTTVYLNGADVEAQSLIMRLEKARECVLPLTNNDEITEL